MNFRPEILTCPSCRHPGDDCICWYLAELAAEVEEELNAA